MYVVVAPAEIAGEAGGDPGAGAAPDRASGGGRDGTYVIVAGRHASAALSSVLDRGEAGELAADAIEGSGGDLEHDPARLHRPRRRRRATAAAPDGDGGGVGAAACILLGLLGAGGARAVRRPPQAARARRGRVRARRSATRATTSSRSATTSARSTSTCRCRTPTRRRKADYDHAVARYTEAEEQWERARTPAGPRAGRRRAGGGPLGDGLGEGALRRRDAARAPAAVLLRPAPRAVVARRQWSPPYGEARDGAGLRGRCPARRARRRAAGARGRVGRAGACRTGTPARPTRRSPAASSAASAAACCRGS